MRYKPLHSNFEEFQDEVARRLLVAHDNVEGVKDAIAREIDEWVEAILREHVEEVSVWTLPGSETCPITVIFSAGDKVLPDGTGALFAREVPLTTILDEFDCWVELSDFGSSSVYALADHLQSFADRLRKRAEEIERDEGDI